MTDPRIAPVSKAIGDAYNLAVFDRRLRDVYTDSARAAIAAMERGTTITTVEELDALPAGTVILCASGWAAQKTDKIDQLWWRTWNEIEVRGGAMNELPARVISWGHRMIICSPDNPGVGALGVYHLPYIEATEGKRHGYDGGPLHGIQWTRNAYHPADPYCPECNPKGATR